MEVAKEALKVAEDKIDVLHEEKRVTQPKSVVIDDFDLSQLNIPSVEQIANMIIAQSNSDVRLSEGERQVLQNVIEAQLKQTITPLKNKLKKSEQTINEYKDKYRDKVRLSPTLTLNTP